MCHPQPNSSRGRPPDNLLLPVAAAWLVSLCANAQETQSNAASAYPESTGPGWSLEEITVTARRREESMQSVSVAVTALGTTELQERTILDTLALGEIVPNLNATSGLSGGSHANYFIRGVGQVDHIASVDPAVALYVDGVYLGRANGADIASLDLERIEVLRGPQGTLFGKNTMGGAIHVVTKRPSDQFEGTSRLILGSREWAEFRGSLNLPIEEGRLATRLSVNARSQDGYGEQLSTGKKLGSEDTVSARGRLLWTPTDSLSVDFQADGLNSHGTANITTLAGIGTLGFFPPDYEATYRTSDPYKTNAGFDAGDDLEVWGASVAVEWRTSGGLTVKSISAYRALEQATGTDFDQSPLSLIDQRQLTDQDQFSQELQLSGSAFGDRLQWLLGAYYFDESIKQAVPVFLLTPTPLNQLNFIDIENISAFGQITWSVTDRLSVTAGGRITDEKKEQTINNFFFADADLFASTEFSDYFNTPQDQRGFETIPPTTLRKRWTAFTPKLSLDFQITEEAFFYLAYAEGFKSGGFNGRPNGSADFLPYDPEELSMYELGAKSEWLDRRLRINGALFFGDYEDVQLLAIRVTEEGALTIFTENAAKAEVYGAELEVTAQPTPSLQLNASVGHLQNRYTEFDSSVLIPGVGPDDELPHAPEWSVNVGAQYGWPLADRFTARVRADYNYRSRYYFFAANNPLDVQKPFDTVNLRLTVEAADRGWTAAVFCRNCFDNFYFAQREDVRDSFDIAIDWPAPPRTWGVELAYDF